MVSPFLSPFDKVIEDFAGKQIGVELLYLTYMQVICTEIVDALVSACKQFGNRSTPSFPQVSSSEMISVLVSAGKQYEKGQRPRFRR